MDPKPTTYLVKPAIVGGIAAAGSMFLFDGAARVPFFGMDMSAPVAIGGAVAVGNIAASLSHDYVLKMLPGNDDPKNIEWQSALLGPALTGGASVLAANMTIGSITGSTAMFQLFALGAGSQVAGSYVFAAIDPTLTDRAPPTMALY